MRRGNIEMSLSASEARRRIDEIEESYMAGRTTGPETDGVIAEKV
jgi:hypothetical protein